MHVLTGRRRSATTAASSDSGESKATKSSPRRSSFSLKDSGDYSASGKNTLRDLFQKHGAAQVTEDASTEKHRHVRFNLHSAVLPANIVY
jgi:hypothetical protein